MILAEQWIRGAPDILEPDMKHERQLARQAVKDPLAFASLYRRHLRAVYAYNMARTGNTQEAQDLTSETFLAALENLTKYRGESSFRAWLIGIAKHKQVDHFRRQRPERALADVEAIPLAESPLEERTTQAIRLRQVANALRSLAPDQAQAVTLRFFAGLSVMETSAVMKKSEAAVKMLTYRGTRSLRERLEAASEVLI
ncbi:MAG: RNA polymerase sigma factor [Anaerolineales bacterium]